MKLKFILSVCTLSIILFSCGRRENESTGVEVVREWRVPFRAEFTNPAPAGRGDSGTFHIQLLEDNTLRYDYQLMNSGGEAITGATLNAGDPITNGPVILPLNIRGTGSYNTGVIFNVRQSLVDSLLANTADIYFSAQGASFANGLVRGQLNTNVTLAADINLTGANEVPPVTTTATGKATIRVTSDRKVYSIVTVTNVEPGDQMTQAHIHVGAPGENGPILVPLVTSPAEFGVPKTISVDEATYNSLMTNRLYVNAHSTLFPQGKVRGQIK